MRGLLGLGVLGWLCCGAWGQTAGRLEFEVASVKPYVAPASGTKPVGTQGGPESLDPGRVHYTNQSLKDLLMTAYSVKRYEISGPAWLDVQKFEIIGKVPEGATKDQVKMMLRSLLEDRFKLAAHRETKELPIYALLPGKNGPKMKESAAEPADTPDSLRTGPPGSSIQVKVKMDQDGCPDFPTLRMASRLIFMNGRGCLTAIQESMPGLAERLSDRFDRPVVDMTGLTPKYDFTLHFDPSSVTGMMAPEMGDNPLPDAFGAVQQQLGLRLESRKGMIDLVVIDHAEKLPTEN